MDCTFLLLRNADTLHCHLTKAINKLTELDATILHASTTLHLKQNSKYKIPPWWGIPDRLRTHVLGEATTTTVTFFQM